VCYHINDETDHTTQNENLHGSGIWEATNKFN
jgi:hypothetical protein